MVSKKKTSPTPYFESSFSYLFLGFLMGIVDSIPGVSGSTVAVVFRQYETIINTISKVLSKDFFNNFFSSLFSKNFFIVWKNYYLTQLALLGGGIVVGIISSFYTIVFLIVNYETLMFRMFSILMITVSFLYLVQHWNIFSKYSKHIEEIMIALIIFVLLSTVLFLVPEMHEPKLGIITFVAGMCAMIAMLLPGVSGSLVLLLFGVYVQIKDAIRELDILYLLIITSGGLVGAVIGIKGISYFSQNKQALLKHCIFAILLAATLHLCSISF